MDSSNAEKAWDTVAQTREFMGCALGGQAHHAFMAGRASRDAEVAELEAVIEKVRGILYVRPGFANYDSVAEGLIRRTLDAAPSATLEDRDRENRAIGWDEGERHESEYLSTYGQFCPGGHCNPYRGDNQ